MEETIRIPRGGTVPGEYKPGAQATSCVTIFDGSIAPWQVDLNNFGKNAVTFGLLPTNDIVLHSRLVSRERHGRFVRRGNVWVIEDREIFDDKLGPSANGLRYNDEYIVRHEIRDGDLIRIDNPTEAMSEGVLFVFSGGSGVNKWSTVDPRHHAQITIGRDPSCTMVLDHISVSKHHATIARDRSGHYTITDHHSTNGVIVNGGQISGTVRLHEKDVITITNAKLIFTSTAIWHCVQRSGISVDGVNLVVERKKESGIKGLFARPIVTCDHTNLSIRPGELVAVVGGSGCGKSTVLNCLAGYLKPRQGEVYINGVPLYKNLNAMKQIIGYVPQADIVYDKLTVQEMLTYTAKLRLPSDTSEQERTAAIERAIATVQLTEKKNSLIGSLSGGQRKRASIAVELLADPNLLFLDEPASGLDPGIERDLMQSLREMADNGKTIILVTHSTLQLQLCDKIVFVGNVGQLCFCGALDEALKFFGVKNVIDIYDKIIKDAHNWRNRFDQTRPRPNPHPNRGTAADVASDPKRENRPKQLMSLTARCMKLVLHDWKRLMLMLGQPLILIGLIALVADGKQFEQYEATKSLLFTLSCAMCWVGMFNTIQEICKERAILRREFMAGLSLRSYVGSKIIALGIFCLLQSVLAVAGFSYFIGAPEEGVLFGPSVELFVTTFLTTLSAAAMGLFVSALCPNADRAMAVAPFLLIPQLLFSGLIFPLEEGATEMLSYVAICRWGMEGYGTTANLNDLPQRLQQLGLPIERTAEDFFEFTAGHLFSTWFILVLFAAACLVLTWAALRLNVRKEDK